MPFFAAFSSELNSNYLPAGVCAISSSIVFTILSKSRSLSIHKFCKSYSAAPSPSVSLFCCRGILFFDVECTKVAIFLRDGAFLMRLFESLTYFKGLVPLIRMSLNALTMLGDLCNPRVARSSGFSAVESFAYLPVLGFLFTVSRNLSTSSW